MSGSAHASGGCGYYGGATGGEDLRARHDRDRDPPAHAIGARYTRSSLHRHSLLEDSRMAGRVPSSSPAPLSASAHTSGGQRQLACDDIVLSCSRLQIADCRFQTMGADFRFLGTQISDFRFQMGKEGGGGNLAHEGEGCGSLQEACPEVVQR